MCPIEAVPDAACDGGFWLRQFPVQGTEAAVSFSSC